MKNSAINKLLEGDKNLLIKALLNTKSISIASISSYSKPFSETGHIVNILQECIGDNFKKLLYFDHPKNGIQYSLPYCGLKEEELNNTFSSLNKIFLERHMICHEGHVSTLSLEETINNLDLSINLMGTCSNFEIDKLYPNQAWTQTEMNIQAGERLSNTIKEFNSIINDLSEIKYNKPNNN